MASRNGSSRHATPSDAHVPGSRLAAEITNAVVALHKAHVGRGPTRGRAYIQDDVITCVLRDGLTAAERTLVDLGQLDLVRRQREQLHDAMAAPLRETLEGLTHRNVVAVLGGVEPEADIFVTVFVLDGATGSAPDAAPRDDRAPAAGSSDGRGPSANSDGSGPKQ
jgi:uncharacterized protein YbcI